MMSASNKVMKDPIVGYVHKLSPLKKGKKSYWFDLELQTQEKQARVVCFTKAKRSIFEEKQNTLTPVQLSNYIIGPRWQGEGEEIRVNDMTLANSLNASEYNFQYVADKDGEVLSLQHVEDNVETGQKVCVRGKIVKGKSIEKVASRGLVVLKSTIVDKTNVMLISLWESEIESVEDRKVYTISNVGVKFYEQTKMLRTTPSSVVIEVEGDEELEDLDDSAAVYMLEGGTDSTVLVKNLLSVTVDKYRSCVECAKKLSEGLESKIVRCMRCSCRMRLADCPEEVTCRVNVVPEGEKKAPLTLTVFNAVLERVFGTSNVSKLTEDDVCERLLNLSHISYNSNNIVSDITKV